MENEILHQDISQLLELITEQYMMICSYEDSIPQIEIDLLKKNVSRLYDDLVTLEKLARGVPSLVNLPGSATLLRIRPAEPGTAEKQEITTTPPTSTETTSPAKSPRKSAEPREPHIKPKPVEKPVMDLFSDNSKTLADQFSADENDNLASRLQQQKLEDIKSVIGINDKFAFIHELFDGNLKDYNDAVARLNAMETLEEAEKYLTELAEDNDWKEKPETYSKLVHFARRKFME